MTTEDQIVELRQMGLTPKQIGERLNVSYKTVYKTLKRNNLVIPRLTREEKEIAIKMREQGMTIAEIAKEVGHSNTTVKAIIKDGGLVPRRYLRVMGTPLEDEIVERYRNGESGVSIMNDTGVSKKALRDLVLRHGLDRGYKAPPKHGNYTADLDKLAPYESFPPNDTFDLHEEERDRLEEVRAAKIKNWKRLNEERIKNEI